MRHLKSGLNGGVRPRDCGGWHQVTRSLGAALFLAIPIASRVQSSPSADYSTLTRTVRTHQQALSGAAPVRFTGAFRTFLPQRLAGKIESPSAGRYERTGDVWGRIEAWTVWPQISSGIVELWEGSSHTWSLAFTRIGGTRSPRGPAVYCA